MQNAAINMSIELDGTGELNLFPEQVRAFLSQMGLPSDDAAVERLVHAHTSDAKAQRVGCRYCSHAALIMGLAS